MRVFRSVSALSFYPTLCLLALVGLPSIAVAQKERLTVRATELKNRGITEAPPQVIEAMFRPVSDYQELLSLSDLVIVGLCKQFVYRLEHDGSEIHTVYTFEMEQVFKGSAYVERRRSEDLEPPKAAKTLGSLRNNEIFVLGPGGTLFINGVKFHTIYKSFPPFQVDTKYVLFLKQFEPPVDFSQRETRYYKGSVYLPTAGPSGCLKISADGAEVLRFGSGSRALAEKLQTDFAYHAPSFIDFLNSVRPRE